MLFRDFRARMGGKKIDKADSLNALKLTKILNTKPELFNRYRIGYKWPSMLSIIILHSRW